MPAVPRIRRAVVDEADVYRPAQGIPVVASMEYPASGTREDVEGLAIANMAALYNFVKYAKARFMSPGRD